MSPPDGAPTAEVLHATPGRLRLRLPPEVLEESRDEALERTLETQRHVNNVRLNRSARSLLLEYDPAALSREELIADVERQGIRVIDGPPLETPEARPEPGETLLRSYVRRWFGASDETVAQASHRLIDLRTLVPLGLGILAVREILSGRVGMAPWYTLAWWTFDSFLKLQPRLPAHTEAPPPPADRTAE